MRHENALHADHDHDLRVDGDRLWYSLMEMAKIGATAKGGVHRLTLTDLDREARDLFVLWCGQSDCTITIDDIGNIFARRAGKSPDKAPVVAGSHLDTQPSGGKFDGAYGVLAALEVVRSLNDRRVETDRPIEIVAWTNEEGSRFPPCMMGSGVFTGHLRREKVFATLDADGHSVAGELTRIGYAGTEHAGNHPVHAYFEAHIEQGPILEDEETTIGVVLGALGQKWFDLELVGLAAHAGPTPMKSRRDALLAASEIAIATNQVALNHSPHGRGTVGSLTVEPNSRNVIPGIVKMSIDFRHLESESLDRMVAELNTRIVSVCQRYDLAYTLTNVADFAPLRFSDTCIDAVRGAAVKLGYSHLDIVSGAGHDAVFLADTAPAGMIFVPCEGGISHNEIENAEPHDLTAGCNVLLDAILRQAGIVRE